MSPIIWLGPDEKVSRIGVGASRSAAGINGTVSVAIYVSSGPTTSPLTYVSEHIINVTTDAKEYHYVDIDFTPSVGTRYIVGVGAAIGANIAQSEFSSGNATNAATWVAGGWLPSWSDNQFNWPSCKAGFMEVVSSLPSVSGPASQAGDNPALPIQTVRASLTSPVSVQYSKDGFASVLGEVFPVINSQTAEVTEVDFSAGFEVALATGTAPDAIPHTGGSLTCRWKVFEEDDITPMYLEFNHSPVATFYVKSVSSGEFTDDNSILKVFSSFLGSDDQHYQPLTVTGGSPSPLNVYYTDVDHPQPNYIGGDSETFTGDVQSVVYLEADGKAHRVTTPIEPFSQGLEAMTLLAPDTEMSQFN